LHNTAAGGASEFFQKFREGFRAPMVIVLIDARRLTGSLGGRFFNLEMQMVARNTLPERFLYYWARLYSQQLFRGGGSHPLCPTISFCFVNGRLFPEGDAYPPLFFAGPQHGD
jgi:hypothetical protein